MRSLIVQSKKAKIGLFEPGLEICQTNAIAIRLSREANLEPGTLSGPKVTAVQLIVNDT
jgi:hypothetical protein